MARAPGLTAIVVLTLAVGIGASTAIFSILQAVLLRPLPYRDSDRLIAIWDGHPRELNLSKVFASYEDFENWRDHARSFESIAAATWATGDQILTGRGPARVVLAIPVTADFFSLLGVSAAVGRTFEPDDSAGCNLVVAHRFWQSALGADPHAVGASLAIDQRSCTVIGIMPADFAFYPEAAEMWRLVGRDELMLTRGVGVFARLRPGVDLATAQAEIALLHRQQHGDNPHDAGLVPVAYRLQDEFTWLAGRTLRLTLLVLFAAVSVVLLIACLNVANVLLGRSVARRRELAIRAALGSGRSRLLAQLLTEGLLLSCAGASIGVALAAAAVAYFKAANPIELPPGSLVALDLRVLAFSAALTILTTLAFGLFPALKASRIDLTAALKSGGRTASDGFAQRAVSRLLVMVEMTCSVVLLVGAGLLIQSVDRFSSAPLGFDPNGVTSMAVRLPEHEYDSAPTRTRFYEDVVNAVGSVPGSNGVALTTRLLRGASNGVLIVDGRPAPPPELAIPDVSAASVSERYFEVLKVPLLVGRSFEPADRDEAPPVAIVNEALASKYFPGASPIGSRVRLLHDSNETWVMIVGVVGNELGAGLHEEMRLAAGPVLFRPILQTAPSAVSLLVRTDGSHLRIGEAVQQVVAKLNPNVPVSDVQMLRDRLAKDMAYPRFRAGVLTAFAAIALVLAIVGLYGVLSQLVAQRTQEIGIRMALGATTQSVLGLVTRQAVAIAGAGLMLGLLAASWLGRFVQAMLYGVQPTDLALLALVSVSLAIAAAVATYIPARRAVGIDPVQALRHE